MVKLYFEKPSFILVIVLWLIGICVGLFLISVGNIYLILGVGVVVLMCFKVNHIISVDQNLNIVSKFFIPKKIPIADITKIVYETQGLGDSKDSLINVYYLENGLERYSILLHFRIFGKKNVINFLNVMDSKVEIDKKSFEIRNIKYDNGNFYDAY